LAGGSDSVASSRAALVLEVRVPSDYPSVVPEVQVRSIKGISNRSTLDLQQKLRDEALRSLGAPMVFTFTQMLKEWLDEHLEGDDDLATSSKEAALALAKTKAALDLEFRGVGDGTPVTPENYQLWWENFLKERESLEGVKVKETRQSGRQFFAQSGSTALVAEARPRTEDGDEGEEGGEVDWSLFEEDELDTELLEDEDEEDDEPDLDDLQALHYDPSELENEEDAHS